MIAGRISARFVLGGCVLGLVVVWVLCGIVIAAADGIAYTAALWLLFNVMSTVGFGQGPTSGLGQVIATAAFIAAAPCWFGIVSVAVEVGLSRFERDALVREALRPLARRQGSKLFHDN